MKHLHTMPRTKLHEQARGGIERLITDRHLKPGSQLPTETDLASELYVSRTTICILTDTIDSPSALIQVPRCFAKSL